jgi:biopolymer transport protein ExbD
MAFGRLENSPPPRPISDINMTPLIDVMLVLLVIFIVTAPLLTASLALELPVAEGAARRDEAAAPAFIALALDAEGRVFLADRPIEPESLGARVRELARGSPDAEVQLRADRRVPYGRVAELMAAVQQAGLTRVGLVIETPAAR